MKIILVWITLIGVLMASSLPKYYEKDLDNGLKVVIIPQKNGSGVVNTDIFYKVGSRNEVMGKSGIAHMLEHLNFKSTKNLKAGEFDTIVKSYGGVNNASTSFDFTHYFIKSSTQNMGTSLHLFADLMENLNLKDEEFQPERDVVAEERRWRTENSPVGYLYFKLFNLTYDYHPYHWTPIGFMGDIQTWSIEDIQSFHKTYYQPNNAIVVIAGDVDEKEGFKAVEKEFGHIKNTGGKIPTVHMVEPEQDGAKRSVIYKDTQTQIVAITYHIPNFEHDDQYALSVISEVLNGGKSSRLQKKLVDELKMVNQLYAYNMENTDPGVYMFLAVCNADIDAKDVEYELLKEIEKLKKEPITKDELEKVMVNMKSDFVYELESSSDIADVFGSYFVRGNVDLLINYEDNIQKVSIKSVQEVANRYFNKKNSTTVILKKEEK